MFFHFGIFNWPFLQTCALHFFLMPLFISFICYISGGFCVCVYGGGFLPDCIFASFFFFFLIQGICAKFSSLFLPFIFLNCFPPPFILAKIVFFFAPEGHMQMHNIFFLLCFIYLQFASFCFSFLYPEFAHPLVHNTAHFFLFCFLSLFFL